MDRARIVEEWDKIHPCMSFGFVSHPEFIEHIATVAKAEVLKEILEPTEAQLEAMCGEYEKCDKEQIDNWLHIKPMYQAAIRALKQPDTTNRTVIDIRDDDNIRFVQRVLEGAATEADRLAARGIFVGIRTRLRVQKS